jgi:hypothetical protein
MPFEIALKGSSSFRPDAWGAGEEQLAATRKPRKANRARDVIEVLSTGLCSLQLKA